MSKQDWMGRSASQRALVLAHLREVGTVGVLSRELYDDPQHRYGRSPRNRVSELIAMGFKIEKRWEGRNYRYILRQEPEKPNPLPDYYTQKEIPWDKRERAKTDNYGRLLETDLPLFAETRS